MNNNYEQQILKFWQKNNIFKKSLAKKSPNGEFVFYDGPPFATGTPHYGHLVASIMKDVVPRYWTMKGYHVERKWGWDCHGLPIENIVEKELKIKNKKDIEDLGVEKFNKTCHSKVLKYVKEWRTTINRLGRWADMDNAYKTMDLDYMESIWWAFKELWDKGLIYEDYKSMHICPRCETTLSQSEVSEGYQDIKDISVIVKFELVDEPGTFILSWTTTPWTLPGNVALAVGEDIDYVLAETKEKPQQKGSSLGVLSPVTKNELPSIENDSINKKFVKGKLSTTDKSKSESCGGPKGSRTPRELTATQFLSPELGPGQQDSPDLLYQEKSGSTNERYILAKNRLNILGDEYEIIKEFKGKELINKKYKPLFPYYKNSNLDNKKNLYTIQSANFVTTDEGTGIVHIAPAFGEDDMNLAKEKNLPFIQHVNMDGTFKDEVKDFKGLHVKPIAPPTLDKSGALAPDNSTDKKIIQYLDKKGLLFSQDKVTHSYPHCWRCETPLLNYATSSYFVNVTKLKPKLLKLAKKINWSPSHIKAGRFGKWLEGARDWSISRQRFWATAIPIWKCESKKCGEQICIGSLKELTKKAIKLGDNKLIKLIKANPDRSRDERNKLSMLLHRPYIDQVKLKCEKCGGVMRRIPDVLDCWFESGSMPYAQMHYPFRNKKKFEENLPAEFIAEGSDQTRAWFYYLHILSTALFEKPAFKNVIVNGIVLAADGKKMSKRLKNYPEPDLIMHKYGADTLRFYLLSSPVMAAENLNFSEAGVKEAYQKVIMLLSNVLEFYKMYAGDHKNTENTKTQKQLKQEYKNIKIQEYKNMSGKNVPSDQLLVTSDNVLDHWILAKLNLLIAEVTKQMDSYNLIRSVRPIQDFINELSTWYIRRSRDRFKGSDKIDKESAISTLREVLSTLAKVMAPFAPFIAEKIYQDISHKSSEMSHEESVHLEIWPKTNEKSIDQDLITQMDVVRQIVSLGLEQRAKAGIPVRQPLAKIAVTGVEVKSPEFSKLIKDELNIQEVKWPDSKANLSVKLDTRLTPELEAQGIARDLTRQINNLRKQKGLTIKDRIAITYETESRKIKSAIKKNQDKILSDTLADGIKIGKVSEGKEVKMKGEKVGLGIRVRN